jgi:hypothetical protein
MINIVFPPAKVQQKMHIRKQTAQKKKIAALLLLEKTPERQDLRGTGPL